MSKKDEIITDKRKTGDLMGLSQVIGSFAYKVVGKKAFAEADVICNWKGIVGDDIASYSKPVKIDFKKGERIGGILIVETLGGAFALELQLKTKFLLDKVNTYFGYEAVKSLRILQNPKCNISSDQSINNSEKVLVTEEEENYIKEVSSDIQNSELEHALQRLGCAVIANNKK